MVPQFADVYRELSTNLFVFSLLSNKVRLLLAYMVLGRSPGAFTVVHCIA
jgi:hypothetical protein